MNGFWLNKFQELARFNADSDKSKYTSEYRAKMFNMQSEYHNLQIDYCNEKGIEIISSSTPQNLHKCRIVSMREGLVDGQQCFEMEPIH